MMKVLSVQEAQRHLAAVCDEALNGEIVRVQLSNGEKIQLTPVGSEVDAALLEYGDESEWAEFENKCAKASD
jgi:hypothetical protein